MNKIKEIPVEPKNLKSAFIEIFFFECLFWVVISREKGISNLVILS